MRTEKIKPDKLERWLDLAKRCARKAGLIQMENLGQLEGYELKGIANLVTKVDIECEKAITQLIKKEEPEHKVLGEELGGDSLDAEYIWVIDPLDGTTNYAHSYLKFCVSVALVHYGKPIVGVVYDPVMNELYYAIRGQGAYLNGKRIQVSKVDKIADALLGTGFAYDRSQKLAKDVDIFVQILPYPQSVRRDGSAALDLCYVACGRYDGFWELNLKPWDISAGVLLVEEAGGVVTDLKGEPISLDGKEVWASNGRIHQELIDILKKGDK